MTLYDYAVEPGFNDPTPTNIEAVVTDPPTTNPDQVVPMGSVRRKTLDRRVHTHGAKRVVWTWAAMLYSDFDALITHIFGDLETENAAATVVTRKRDDTFGTFNAIAHLPLPGSDYQRDWDGEHVVVRNLRLEFEILEEVA